MGYSVTEQIQETLIVFRNLRLRPGLFPCLGLSGFIDVTTISVYFLRYTPYVYYSPAHTL
jgi:hypothetical protein